MSRKYGFYLFSLLIFSVFSCQQKTFNSYMVPATLSADFAAGLPEGNFGPSKIDIGGNSPAEAARGDTETLSDNGFHPYEMMEINSQLPEDRRLYIDTEPLMITYSPLGHQVLTGTTINNARAALIIDSAKKLLYYRVEGSFTQLKELNFETEKLTEANNLLDEEKKIVVDNDFAVCAVNVRDETQMMIGKNSGGKTAMVVISKKGTLLGYGIQD